LKELDDKYEDYAVYDKAGEKIGKVDDIFLDETDREEYIGVKMGLFGLSGKTLIPMEMARVDEQERRIEVGASKDQAKSAPHYHDDDEIDHEFEAKIRDHFGLERQEASSERGTHGRYVGATVGEGLGAPAGETSTGPAQERTIRRDVDEPLEPREETRDDEPSEQRFTIIRVRR